jgi:hypothetical protein
MTNSGAVSGLADSAHNLSELRGYQARLDSAWSLSPTDAGEIVGIIDSAFAVHPPDGSPASIMDAAESYSKASSAYLAFCTRVHSAAGWIFGSWTGTRADAVSAAFSALLTASEEEAGQLSRAGEALRTWALALRDAQAEDAHGRMELVSAATTLGTRPASGIFGDIAGAVETVFNTFVELPTFESAVSHARRGVTSMADGASVAERSGEDVARTLTQLASQGGSWPAAMSKATQAAEQAHDTTGFSVDAADVQHATTLLQSASGKLTAGLSGTELPPASAFGSNVAAAWSAFNSRDLSIREAVNTTSVELKNITQNDIRSYLLADHTVGEKAAKIGATPGSLVPQSFGQPGPAPAKDLPQRRLAAGLNG